MKITYTEQQFYSSSRTMINRANDIIDEYLAMGFDLTIRQLHYQFVSRDMGPNTQKHYNKLSKTISNARRAGLVDWLAIVDRTRYVRSLSHWENEAEIISDVASQFRVDKWERQKYRPRVWIEKDALIGVIAEACEDFDVPYFSTRGYPSDSSVWRDAQRFNKEIKQGQIPVVIHLADHDPSGLDMTRDIGSTLWLFWAYDAEVKRIGLTIDQVREYDPPPNFAKETDPRWKQYKKEFGPESWELDALEPQVLADLIQDTILDYRDNDIWKEDEKRENEARIILQSLSHNIADVKEFLSEFQFRRC